MIERYTLPEMGHIWSRREQVSRVARSGAGHRGSSRETGRSTRLKLPNCCGKHASFQVARIQEIEREVKHDVIAFTTAVSQSMARAGHPEASRWLHYGLTSNDVVDTAQALMIRSASQIILRGVSKLAVSLKTRAFEFKHTVQIGRTHGIQAEPITFGLKLALWYDEVQRNLDRFSAAAEDMRVGQDLRSGRDVRPHRSRS